MTGAPLPADVITPVLHSGGARAPASSGWLRRQWRAMQRPRIESGWASVCGVNHARNQDAVLVAAPLFAVADGVGGGSAGELASSQMLAWCRSIPPRGWQRPEELATTLRQADVALAEALKTLHPGGRSATTFAGAWLRPNGSGCIGHVGDSRILHLRPRAGSWLISQLTMDQTYRNLNESPPSGSKPDDPARMLGVGAVGDPGVARLRMRENDTLLLCSDGLHRFVPASMVAAICQREANAGLHVMAERLVQAAQASGSHDDISVLLVRRNPIAGVRRAFWLAAAGVLAVALLVMLGVARVPVPGPFAESPSATQLPVEPAVRSSVEPAALSPIAPAVRSTVEPAVERPPVGSTDGVRTAPPSPR